MSRPPPIKQPQGGGSQNHHNHSTATTTAPPPAPTTAEQQDDSPFSREQSTYGPPPGLPVPGQVDTPWCRGDTNLFDHATPADATQHDATTPINGYGRPDIFQHALNNLSPTTAHVPSTFPAATGASTAAGHLQTGPAQFGRPAAIVTRQASDPAADGGVPPHHHHQTDGAHRQHHTGHGTTAVARSTWDGMTAFSPGIAHSVAAFHTAEAVQQQQEQQQRGGGGAVGMGGAEPWMQAINDLGIDVGPGTTPQRGDRSGRPTSGGARHSHYGHAQQQGRYDGPADGGPGRHFGGGGGGGGNYGQQQQQAHRGGGHAGGPSNGNAMSPTPGSQQSDALMRICRHFPPPPPVDAPAFRNERAVLWYGSATQWDLSRTLPPPPRCPLQELTEESVRGLPMYSKAPYNADFWIKASDRWFEHVQTRFRYPPPDVPVSGPIDAVIARSMAPLAVIQCFVAQ